MTSFTKRISSMFAVGLCAAMVAGCGGGAVVGTSAMRPQSQSPVLTAQSTNGVLSTKAANGNVTFAIGIHRKTKGGRITPKYVSPSTQSLQILTDGTNPVVVNLTRWYLNCPQNPAVPGAYICTASLNVPAGNHVFTVTTYDLPGATGNVLSTNSTGTVVVKPTGPTTVSIVLEGVVQYVALVLTTTNPAVGTASAIGLTVSLGDADHNFIVGPAPYEHPVTLTTTDSTNGQLSTTTLKSPADSSGITANYTGAKVASITYSATATGLPPANVIDAVLMPGAPPTKPQYLYVENTQPDSVSVFDTAHGNAVLPAITGGLSAEGIAVDASGKLYVSNWLGASVSVFDTAHSNAVLPAITGGGLNKPAGLAVDASGKLFVATWDNATQKPKVSVFDTAHGNAALPTIYNVGGSWPALNLAVDASGKLYVPIASGKTVSVIDTVHDNAVLSTITGGGLAWPGGAAVDASGKLYVANGEGVNTVSVFDTARGNMALPAINGSGLNAGGIAVDASGKLYVANYDSNSISVFDTAHGNMALPRIVGGGLNMPVSLAVH
jgi:hypothetical protein